MATRTRFVFLMHPKEFKQEKAGTGRLTHLCLPNSVLRMGLAFDDDETVRALLADPEYYPVLLYPGREAFNLSDLASGASGGAPDADGRFQRLREALRGRRLAVFILDATWSGARKMLRLSPSLQRLPRAMFIPSVPSRYVIKQQPQEGCLSTLEATHELLTILDRLGLDTYVQPDLLLGIFQRMQDYQLQCASDPNRVGYRHRPYKPPAERLRPRGRSGSRREKYLPRSAGA